MSHYPRAAVSNGSGGVHLLGNAYEISQGKFEAVTRDGELISPGGRAAVDAIFATRIDRVL